MTTVVLTTCPCCGDVKLPISDVRLHVCAQDPNFSWYAFSCPTCAAPVVKHADPQAVRLLASGGIRPAVWDGPSWHPPGAPPITEDEVVRFARDLARTACPAAWVVR